MKCTDCIHYPVCRLPYRVKQMEEVSDCKYLAPRKRFIYLKDDMLEVYKQAFIDCFELAFDWGFPVSDNDLKIYEEIIEKGGVQ